MKGMIDETELARLEALAVKATTLSFEDMVADGWGYVVVDILPAVTTHVPALVAEVRRLRRNYECSEKSLQRHEHMVAELMEKVEAWEWFEEVRIYKPWNEHPNWEACGNSSKRGKIFDRAVDEYKLIYKAAREAVHADRE